jgi:chromosome partitioning protein
LATTICLINQKGGCGKSSTCFHLAGAFAADGQSVLLVDADPQGSLSQGFFGSEWTEQLAAHETLAALFDESTYFLEHRQLIRSTNIEGISLIPANQYLADYNYPRPADSGLQQFALRELLEELSGFDVILIDCPPNLYQCSWNAMVAADYVVIPVPPEDFGTQGLRAVHQAIDQVRRLNPTLWRLGHMVTRCDRRLLVHRSYEERLRQLYRGMVLDTVMPEASAFKVALTCRTPVQFSHPRSVAAAAMRGLVSELQSRITARNGNRNVA